MKTQQEYKEESVPRQTNATLASTYQLSQMFKISQENVRLKISPVEPAQVVGGKSLYYVFEVAPFLVTPKVNLKKYVEGLRGKDLPASWRKDYWDAEDKKMGVLLKAQELYSREDVERMLGRIVAVIALKYAVLPDMVKKVIPVSSEQMGSLDALVDDIREETYKACEAELRKTTLWPYVKQLLDRMDAQDIIDMGLNVIEESDSEWEDVV